MKTIFRIFFRDLHRIRTNVVALVVAIGICIIPALYAWFNLAANWNPYGSTSGIHVAVANDDEAADFQGLSMQIGDQIVENLKANDAIGWQFVSSKEAMEGVKDGTYYAAIIIPKTFTADMLSFLSDNMQHPQIEYYVNEKKNAIAPKITDKGASVIQEQVNTTFIDTAVQTLVKALNVSSDELGVNGTSLIDNLITNLKTLNRDLKDYGTTIDSFIATTASVNELLNTAKLMVPDVTDTITSGKQSIADVQATLDNTQASAADVTSALGTALDSMQSIIDQTASVTQQSVTDLTGGIQSLDGDIDWVFTRMNRLMDFNNQITSSLSNINSSLPEPLDSINNVIYQINDLTENEQDILNLLNTTNANLSNNIAVGSDVQNQLQSLLDTCRSNISNVRNSFSGYVAPSLNNLINSLSTVTGNTSGLLTSIDGSMGNMDEIFDGLSTSLSNGNDSLTSTKTLIKNMRKKVKNIIEVLDGTEDDQKFQKLLEILQSDPDTYGSFMSSPVELKTTTLYPIENYGSAMTPFYSILAIWVGGIVLVAIMKVNVDEDDKIKNIRPHQAYFGRYLLFFLMGQIQAFIICIGNLYFLQVQCKDPVLFVLAGSVSSLVFTSIIYTLTVSFGAIGKALSVIFLVLQLAGAGGTYPVEVLPEFFQNINPYFPFTYGINAMRETVGGLYKDAYWKDLGTLLCFISVSLLLGLILRRPLIRLTNFFERRLEESKIL